MQDQVFLFPNASLNSGERTSGSVLGSQYLASPRWWRYTCRGDLVFHSAVKPGISWWHSAQKKEKGKSRYALSSVFESPNSILISSRSFSGSSLLSRRRGHGASPFVSGPTRWRSVHGYRRGRPVNAPWGSRHSSISCSVISGWRHRRSIHWYQLTHSIDAPSISCPSLVSCA